MEALIKSEWREGNLFQVPLLVYTILFVNDKKHALLRAVYGTHARGSRTFSVNDYDGRYDNEEDNKILEAFDCLVYEDSKMYRNYFTSTSPLLIGWSTGTFWLYLISSLRGNWSIATHTDHWCTIIITRSNSRRRQILRQKFNWQTFWLPNSISNCRIISVTYNIVACVSSFFSFDFKMVFHSFLTVCYSSTDQYIDTCSMFNSAVCRTSL